MHRVKVNHNKVEHNEIDKTGFPQLSLPSYIGTQSFPRLRKRPAFIVIFFGLILNFLIWLSLFACLLVCLYACLLVCLFCRNYINKKERESKLSLLLLYFIRVYAIIKDRKPTKKQINTTNIVTNISPVSRSVYFSDPLT